MSAAHRFTKIEFTELQAACSALSARRSVQFADAIAGLERLAFTVQCACIVNEYAPDELDQLVKYHKPSWNITPSDLLEHRWDIAPLESFAFSLVTGLFPCEDSSMEEIMLNQEPDEFCLPSLIFMPQGWPYSDDEISEFIVYPENYSDSESLLVFAVYLTWCAELVWWKAAAGRFGWPDREPEYLIRSDPEAHFDRERFLELLDRNGLEDFQIAFIIAWKNTGNEFLDNTYQEILEIGIEFSLANVRDIAAEWAAARPMIDQYNRALELFTSHPHIAERLIVLWDSCVEYLQRPTTLVELFAQNEDAGNNAENVFIHPLDGPVGLDDGDEYDD